MSGSAWRYFLCACEGLKGGLSLVQGRGIVRRSLKGRWRGGNNLRIEKMTVIVESRNDTVYFGSCSNVND